MSDPTDAALEELVTTETQELDVSSAPPSPSKRTPDALPIGANKAKKTQDDYRTGLKYIDWFLKEQNLPSFDKLTDKDVEADHLQNFIDNNMHWMAITQIKTPRGCSCCLVGFVEMVVRPRPWSIICVSVVAWNE